MVCLVVRLPRWEELDGRVQEGGYVFDVRLDKVMEPIFGNQSLHLKADQVFPI